MPQARRMLWQECLRSGACWGRRVSAVAHVGVLRHRICDRRPNLGKNMVRRL